MTYVRAALRREVIDRFLPYEVDHIIAEKHGGVTNSANLCWSCYLCNGYKGSDIGSIDWEGSGKITSLFNPRQQNWNDHFRFDQPTAYMFPLTPEGRVTVFLLKLNGDEQIASHKLLTQSGRFPCSPLVNSV
jgi:hypothetical protein